MLVTQDPTRIGDPEYRRHLERRVFADDEDWERPWLRYQTAGEYDPYNIR
jgi:hypothetical protein